MIGKAQKLKKLNKIVGLEVSESCIVAVEMQFTKNSIFITNGFTLEIPVFEDLNKTAEYLKQNFKVSGIKTRNVAIGLSLTYCKLFPVPIPTTIPENEIGMIVAQEGNVDVQNEACAWAPLQSTYRQEADGVSKLDFLGISTQKGIIDSLEFIAKRCSLKINVLSPAFYGLRFFLAGLNQNTLLATLWVSQIKSELVVWSGSDPIYEHLFLTLQLKDQVFQSVNLIQTQIPGTQVSTILTCGPNIDNVNLSQMPYNISKFVFDQTIVDKGNVLQRQTVSEIISAVGLAIQASGQFPVQLPNLLESRGGRGFSLKDLSFNIPSFNIPIKIKGETLDPLLSKFIIASVIVFLISLLSNVFIQTLLMPGVSSDKGVFASKVKQAEIKLKQVSNNQNVHKVLSLKTEFLSGVIEYRMPWSDILREIADMIPKNLWIDRLDIRNKDINIFGRALNVDSVANFSINLNYTAKLLTKAQIIALRKFQEDDIDFIEFQVSARAKNPAEKNEPTNAKAKKQERKMINIPL